MRTLFALVALLSTSAFASPPPVAPLLLGQCLKRSDGIHCGSKNTDVYIDGNVYVTSPDGGSYSSTPGSATNPVGTSKVAVLDAGVALINGQLQVSGNIVLAGKVPTLRADVVDAGQLFVQGFGPVTRIIPFTTAAIDFASVSITCVDSAGTTVTGARTTDACIVGMPSTLTSGGTGLHHTFTCYVSAADTVKIRGCATGTADDPASVTFTGFVISQAQ